ncbi:3-oxoacyl-[acyl-carrier-protein] reductase FabG [Reticulibacter mediterranei]|uniref:3-oxoacyl-[acyl-carrier-protein] reductase FabG n=1 Tax=Reticulibacter mediterranei TaxID=2778369 RepID=A0A8J3NAX9_9CHLR|nr:SDR family oxidoreductase [Reticulibacter mediterranei]GHP00878.1 3-oxoacyl-[acyl-carrier-protein] reductase FabG [Reticulibacter mediterranei]
MAEHKTVLITGAANGIGRACAFAFAKRGADLALIDKQEEALACLVHDLRHTSPTCTVSTVVADLVSDDIHETVTSALLPFRRIDILLSNAGKLVTGTVEELKEEQWRESFEINFFSHLALCQAIIPRMQQQPEGSILFTASDQALQPDAGLAAYASPKTALLALTKILARELAPHVRVNAVAPGMTRTNLVEPLLERLATEFQTDPQTAEQLELQRRGVPLARLGEAEEIAEVMVTLSTGPFCTGCIWNISGGYVGGIGA